MVESVARVRFQWDAEGARCRASAFDARDRLLGEIVVELPAEVRRAIQAVRGASMRLRIEEIAERNLRAMLELRH